jgi:hypothetical protein
MITDGFIRQFCEQLNPEQQTQCALLDVWAHRRRRCRHRNVSREEIEIRKAFLPITFSLDWDFVQKLAKRK